MVSIHFLNAVVWIYVQAHANKHAALNVEEIVQEFAVIHVIRAAVENVVAI